MKKSEKKQWILDYMENPKNSHTTVDVASYDFVNAYIDACAPNKIIGVASIPYVPELGRYLSEMYKDGILWRYTRGCLWTQDGFPKWVYVYKLKEKD